MFELSSSSQSIHSFEPETTKTTSCLTLHFTFHFLVISEPRRVCDSPVRQLVSILSLFLCPLSIQPNPLLHVLGFLWYFSFIATGRFRQQTELRQLWTPTFERCDSLPQSWVQFVQTARRSSCSPLSSSLPPSSAWPTTTLNHGICLPKGE